MYKIIFYIMLMCLPVFASIQVLPPGTATDPNAIRKDGTIELTADWDIGDGFKIQTDEIRARDGAGLKLFDDAGIGIFIEDGGQIGIGIAAPISALHVDSNAADSTGIVTIENTAGDCKIFRVTSNPEGSLTADRCDIAIGIVASEGIIFIKEQGDGNNVGWKQVGTAHFANMLIHANSTATEINTVNIAHFIQGLFIDEISEDFTFAVGSTGPISAFADAGGGQVTVSDTAHGLSTGDVVSISGTTSYNDVFTIANALTDTYEITDTFVADDATGNWYKGDSVTADAGSAGIYTVSWSAFGLSAGNNKDFRFNVYKNSTSQNSLESKRRFQSSVDIGDIDGGGIISIADGDIITFAITGLTDTTNFTFEHISLSLHKL